MKLSEELNQIHMSGDAGLMLEGFSERAKALEDAVEVFKEMISDYKDACDEWCDESLYYGLYLVDKAEEALEKVT